MNHDLPQLLATCSVRGTILILLALATVPLVRRALGPAGAHYLWVAALVALMWPWPPRTVLSVENLWPSLPVQEIALAAEAAPPTEVQTQVHLLPPTEPEQTLATAPPLPPALAAVAAQPARPAARRLDLRTWLVAIWGLVAAALLLRLAWRSWQTHRLLGAATPLTGEEAAALLGDLPHRVELRTTRQLAAPALAGILRPRILLPEAWLGEITPEARRAIFLHEVGHHVRRDLVWEWLFALAACVHWFNPLVWLAQHFARQERELACDAWVLERMHSPEEYGLALLEVIQHMGARARSGFRVVAMADRRSQVSLRMEWIRRYQRRPRWAAAVAWVPALLILAAVGTERFEVQAEQVPPPKPQLAAVQLPDPVAAPSAVSTGPLEPLKLSLRTMQVNSVLLRVPESVATSMKLQVAAEGSNGVSKLLEAAAHRELLRELRETAGVEILPVPRMVSQLGSRASARMVQEFRYPTGYDVSTTTPGLHIPREIVTRDLGLRMELEPFVEEGPSLRAFAVIEVVRLQGFLDAAGNLTPPLPLPAEANWYDRLTSWNMPVGVGGVPQFTAQTVDNLMLKMDATQATLVFGFRDSETTAPGEEKMINYFLMQTSVAP